MNYRLENYLRRTRFDLGAGSCGGRGELPSRKLSPPHLLRLERRELRRPWRIAISKIISAAPAST
ncbi:MAG: hypothetical protein MST10_09515 [Lentisphaeria bacterium]|nr:hypothetical protein [Lentisphaeria bacterium]